MNNLFEVHRAGRQVPFMPCLQPSSSSCSPHFWLLLLFNIWSTFFQMSKRLDCEPSLVQFTAHKILIWKYWKLTNLYCIPMVRNEGCLHYALDELYAHTHTHGILPAFGWSKCSWKGGQWVIWLYIQLLKEAAGKKAASLLFCALLQKEKKRERKRRWSFSIHPEVEWSKGGNTVLSPFPTCFPWILQIQCYLQTALFLPSQFQMEIQKHS